MKENNPHILGTEKVGKLLLEYSIPAIIGMTLTSLYNIIDSVFIGHGVGAMAISGLAISFPLMNLLVAFCTLVGVGGATISSIRLGRTGVYPADGGLYPVQLPVRTGGSRPAEAGEKAPGQGAAHPLHCGKYRGAGAL